MCLIIVLQIFYGITMITNTQNALFLNDVNIFCITPCIIKGACWHVYWTCEKTQPMPMSCAQCATTAGDISL